MKSKQYCPRCRKFTESIIDEDREEVICKRCAKKHKALNFSKILTGA